MGGLLGWRDASGCIVCFPNAGIYQTVGNASVACEGGRSLRSGALNASGRHEERELSTTADDGASPATLYELAPARLCIRRGDAGVQRVDNSGGGQLTTLSLPVESQKAHCRVVGAKHVYIHAYMPRSTSLRKHSYCD